MRTITKLTIAAVLLALPLSLLMAQVPIKQDLIKMLEAVPAPPASAKDAYSKLAVTDAEGSISYEAANVFAATDQQIKSIEETYTEQAKSAVLGMPGSMPGGGAMTEADAERIQGMTKEQKIAMAMAMAGTMNQPVQMEPPAIKAAQEAWMALYAQTQEEFQRGLEMQQKEGQLQSKYDQAHNELDSLKAIEIGKLPQISTGEMSYPDPVLMKAVKIKFADRHIVLADKGLAETGKLWQAEVTRIKTRNADFLKKLQACGYAAGAKNPSTKKVLSDGQMTVFKALLTQLEISRHAWKDSAAWQGRKVLVEQEKY